MPHFLLVFYDDENLAGSGNGDAVKGAYDIQDIILNAIDHADKFNFMDVFDLREARRKLVFSVDLERVRETMEEIFREWQREEPCQPEPLRN